MTPPPGIDKLKLAEKITHRLDPAATAGVREHIRAQCERCVDDYKACFETGLEDDKGQPIAVDVKDQCARLLAIEETLGAAARAIGQEPQEIDWRPRLAPLLARFVKRLCRYRFIRQAEAGYAKKFHAAVQWFDLLWISPTELSVLLHTWARLAGGTARRLVPKARSIPKEDFFAHWGWRLVHEFAPELNPEVVRDPSELPFETVADYIAANWSRLSPYFRAAHNRLLEAKERPVIPPPEVDHYIPPTPAQRQQFPWKKYVTVTKLLAQYVVGRDMTVRRACEKVRSRYSD